MDTRRRRPAKSFPLVRWVCHLPYDIAARPLVVGDCWIGGQNQPQRPLEWAVRQAGFLTVSLSVREISRLEGSGAELATARYRLAARPWNATGSGRNLGQRQTKGNLLSRFKLALSGASRGAALRARPQRRRPMKSSRIYYSRTGKRFHSDPNDQPALAECLSPRAFPTSAQPTLSARVSKCACPKT